MKLTTLRIIKRKTGDSTASAIIDGKAYHATFSHCVTAEEAARVLMNMAAENTNSDKTSE